MKAASGFLRKANQLVAAFRFGVGMGKLSAHPRLSTHLSSHYPNLYANTLQRVALGEAHV